MSEFIANLKVNETNHAELSLDEILNNERGGVYTGDESDGFIVVFPRINDEYINALFVGDDGRLEDVDYAAWENFRFHQMQGAKVKLSVEV